MAVLSTPLAEVNDDVALVRRQILIAGLIALVAASLIGFWASGAVSRRLRRLREAAEAVADGHFDQPIPVDSSDELGQLARSFNDMQRRLARLDSSRKEFIANASHELRTPIFSLGGFVELLETENLTAAERRAFVAEMRDTSRAAAEAHHRPARPLAPRRGRGRDSAGGGGPQGGRPPGRRRVPPGGQGARLLACRFGGAVRWSRSRT